MRRACGKNTNLPLLYQVNIPMYNTKTASGMPETHTDVPVLLPSDFLARAYRKHTNTFTSTASGAPMLAASVAASQSVDHVQARLVFQCNLPAALQDQASA